MAKKKSELRITGQSDVRVVEDSLLPEDGDEQDYCADCGRDLAVSEKVAQKGQFLQFCDICREKPENKARLVQPEKSTAQLAQEAHDLHDALVREQDRRNTKIAEKIIDLAEERGKLGALKDHPVKNNLHSPLVAWELASEALKRNNKYFEYQHKDKLEEIQRIQDKIDEMLDAEKRRIKVEKLTDKLLRLKEDLEVFENMFALSKSAREKIESSQLYLPGFGKEAAR